MSGIMSSPPAVPESPRRALGELSNNRRPITPDSTPVKRRKVTHTYDKDDDTCRKLWDLSSSPVVAPTPRFVPSMTRLWRRELGQDEGDYDGQVFPIWNYATKEAQRYYSDVGHRDVLPALAPWLNCEPQQCCPFSVAPFHHRNDVVLGLQGGHLCFSNIGKVGDNRQEDKPYTGIPGVATDAILDLSVSCDDQLVAVGSGDGMIRVFDTEQRIVLHESFEPGTRQKRIEFCPHNPELLLAGDTGGTMSMIDLRLRDAARAMGEEVAPNHHKVEYLFSRETKSTLQKAHYGLTAVTWMHGMRAAAGCESFSGVKMLDFRYLKPNSKYYASCLLPEIAAPKHQKRHFGVTSLAYDTYENKIWALSRDNHIYSFYPSNPSRGVVDDYFSASLTVDNYHTTLSLVDSPENISNAGYVACGGGRNGSVCLFAKTRDHGEGIVKTSADALLQHGHSSTVTAVTSAGVNGDRIASISDDGTARYWGVDDRYTGLEEHEYTSGVGYGVEDI